MKRHRITDCIEYLRPEDEIGRFLCSGMVVRGSGTALFDANWGERDTEELLVSEKPDFALISHYHLDHALWAGYVGRFSDAQVLVPSGEENYMTDPEFFLDRTLGSMPSMEPWRRFVLRRLGSEGFRDFKSYDASFTLDLGKTRMVLVPAPGHSPGHTTAYFPIEKILFTSDLGFGPFGPWYGFRDCSIIHYVESLLKLKAMKPSLLLTGHDGIIRNAIDGAFDRVIQAFFSREEKIREGLQGGSSRGSLVREGIYFRNKAKAKGPLKDFLADWDAIMFDHHVGVLEQGGLEAFFHGIGKRTRCRQNSG